MYAATCLVNINRILVLLCFGDHVRGVGKGGQIITNSGLSCFEHQTGVQKVFLHVFPGQGKIKKQAKPTAQYVK